MKFFFLLIIIIITYSVKLHSQITFIKSFDCAGNDGGTYISQTSDSGYIISGSIDKIGVSGRDAFLIKTDKFGDTMWTKSFDNQISDEANFVTQTPDNGFIVAGNFGGNGCVIRLNSLGDTLWAKTVSMECIYVTQLTTLEYIIGGTGSIVTGNRDFCLMKIDSSGNIIWARTYGGSEDDNAAGFDRTNDGGFIMVGTTQSFTPSGYDVYVVKADSLGNIKWAHAYDYMHLIENGNSIKQTHDGGYIITGNFSNYTNDEQAILIKTDSTGNVVWAKNYGDIDLEHCYSANLTLDSSYIIAGGSKYPSAFIGFAYLIKCDLNGDTIWTKTIRSDIDMMSTSLTPTLDSGFALTGFTNANNREIFFIKTDKFGNTVTCNNLTVSTRVFNWNVQAVPAPTIVDSINISINNVSINISNGISVNEQCAVSEINYASKINSIEIYPNPFSDFVSISVDQNEMLNSKISIYNSMGKLVYNNVLPDLIINLLNLSFLDDGIYLVKISNESRCLIKKIIKK